MSSLSLDAFFAVAQLKNFTSAAKSLHITQSALSQRIINLEKNLGAIVFTRESTGIRLTKTGEKLFRYCQNRIALEKEFLHEIEEKNELRGNLRIAGFSTINASILIPVIGKFISLNPSVHLEIYTKEIRDLAKALEENIVDYIFTTSKDVKKGITSQLLGYEYNVLVESTKNKARQNIYLDHDSEDTTTMDFFSHQKKQVKLGIKIEHNYLGDIHSILSAVKHGFGRAVVPIHLVEGDPSIKIISGHNSLKVPIYLQYYEQRFYTKIHKEIIQFIVDEIPKKLFNP